MNANKLNDWLQIIGMFSVVASLVFVGFELRQAHEISLSQAYQSRASAAVEFNSAFAANAAALSAFRKSAEGAGNTITAEERDALTRTLFGVYFLYDNAYYQYQQGFVSDDFWLTTRRSMKAMMSNPFAESVFMERLDVAGRPEFREEVLGIQEELTSEGRR